MIEHDKSFIGISTTPQEFKEFKYSKEPSDWNISYHVLPNETVTKNFIDKDKLLQVLRQELDKAVVERNPVEIAIKKIIIERIENYVEE